MFQRHFIFRLSEIQFATFPRRQLPQLCTTSPTPAPTSSNAPSILSHFSASHTAPSGANSGQRTQTCARDPPTCTPIPTQDKAPPQQPIWLKPFLFKRCVVCAHDERIFFFFFFASPVSGLSSLMVRRGWRSANVPDGRVIIRGPSPRSVQWLRASQQSRSPR